MGPCVAETFLFLMPVRHRAVSVASQIQTSTIVATINSASPRLTARRVVGRSMSLLSTSPATTQTKAVGTVTAIIVSATRALPSSQSRQRPTT